MPDSRNVALSKTFGIKILLLFGIFLITFFYCLASKIFGDNK